MSKRTRIPESEPQELLVPASTTDLLLPTEDREERIAVAAYYRSEQRGFLPGKELEDWLAAEEEIDALLGNGDIGIINELAGEEGVQTQAQIA